MTVQKIVDSIMQDVFSHDNAEAAVLSLLDIVETTAGTENPDREETPENRRHEAAAQLLAYFLKKHAAK